MQAKAPSFDYLLSCLGEDSKKRFFTPINCPMTGTTAHREGLPSFPAQSGTASLLLPPRNEQTTHQSAHDVGKQLVSKHLATCLAERAEHHKQQFNVQKTCTTRVQRNPSKVLQFSNTLRSLGDWAVLPSMAESCCLVFHSDRLCQEAPESISISELARAWKWRHYGIPKAPARQVRTSSESACWRDCCCTCKRSGPSPTYPARILWQKLRQLLQQLFEDKGDLQLLLNGDIIYLFVATTPDNKEIIHVKATYVALQYLRPWRPTMLLLEFASDSELAKANKMFLDRDKLQSKPFSAHPAETDFLSFKVKPFESQHLFSTALEFCLSLDWNLVWSVAVLRLSERLAPWSDSNGCVRAWMVKLPHIVWQGNRDIPEKPAASHSTTQAPATDTINPDDRDSDSEGEADIPEKDQAHIDLNFDLAGFWGEGLEDAECDRASSGSGSSDSSSSSRWTV